MEKMSVVYRNAEKAEARLHRPSIMFSSYDSLDDDDDAAAGDGDDDYDYNGGDSVSPLRRASSFSYPPNYYRHPVESAADATNKGESPPDTADHLSRSKPVKGTKGSSNSWTPHLPIAFGAHQVIAPSATATRPSKIPSRSQSAAGEAIK